MHVMMELRVTLDFSCCGCGQKVTVTLQCAGAGLAAQPVASVNVPCPGCGQVNQLFFEPSGTVRCVRLYPCARLIPEPSVN